MINAVRQSGEFHLYNLAKAFNTEDEPADKVVVVTCPRNTPYGCCIDRGSNVTIVLSIQSMTRIRTNILNCFLKILTDYHQDLIPG